jgi:acetoacetyl-CoA reductase
MNDTQDRVALVTGGTRGTGAAISTCLARSGARIAALYDRDPDAADSFAKAAGDDGLTISVHQANVGNPGDCQRVADEILHQYGHIDYLVNTTGTGSDRPAEKMSLLDWEQVLRANLSGPFFMSKAVLGHFIGRGSGCIVNISSYVGQTGRIGQSHYAAASAGLQGLTKSLALETAGHGVTVNCVVAGAIATDMPARLPEAARQAVAESIPMGAIGSADDVAQAVRYLVSAEARYVTGAFLPVTGGLLMM